jgi:hypothetical protein
MDGRSTTVGRRLTSFSEKRRPLDGTCTLGIDSYNLIWQSHQIEINWRRWSQASRRRSKTIPKGSWVHGLKLPLAAADMCTRQRGEGIDSDRTLRSRPELLWRLRQLQCARPRAGHGSTWVQLGVTVMSTWSTWSTWHPFEISVLGRSQGGIGSTP